MKRLLVLAVLALCMVVTARGEGPEDQYLNIYTLIQEGDSLSGQPAQALSKYLQAQMALQRLQRIYPEWSAKIVNFRLNYLSLKIQGLSAQTQPKTGSNAVVGVPSDKGAATAARPATPNESERQLEDLQQRLHQMEAEKLVLESKLKEAFSAQPAILDPRELSNALAQVKSLEKENGLLKVSLAQEKARISAAPLAKPPPASSPGPVSPEAAVAPGLAALQAENAMLRKQLTDVRAVPVRAGTDPGSGLAQANKQIASLQSEKEALRMEKTVLEGRIRQMSQTTNSLATPQVSESARVKQLQGERDQLQKKLAEAMKELYSRKGKALTARLEGMEGQILALRSRVEVFEARQVPYTAEELALFRKPETQLAAKQPEVQGAKKSVRELPPGTTALVAEAQKFFSARQYDKAEKNYMEVLSHDRSNVPTLANLAAIELQMGRLDAAETNVQKALKIEPNDAFSLTILGHIKLKQEKYDESLEALSRAAKMEPQNAQIQNLLGLTLSQKGLRGPAETAFRKAVQLDPGFGDAHNNLAVIYLSQQPPMIELARWHYQKARAAGNAPDPTLEKAFENKQAASTGH